MQFMKFNNLFRVNEDFKVGYKVVDCKIST